MNMLNAVGMMIFIGGLQIVLRMDWNVFNDPYSVIVFLMTMIICKGFQITTVTI